MSNNKYAVTAEQNNHNANDGAQNVKAPETKKAASAFRTISEVSTELGVQQHVLRFWETKFSQVRPLKRGGGRRYYRPEDVKLLQKIHQLLYTEGYTIKGVQKLLRQHGKNTIMNTDFSAKTVLEEEARAEEKKLQPEKKGLSDVERDVLQTMLAELKALRSMIKD